MTQAQAIMRATHDTLARHGVVGWSVMMDARTDRMGACDHARKIVVISKANLTRGPIAVRETIRHEVAHVLAGPNAGHGDVWREACKITGSTGIRFAISR